jgi:hypothetical protein
MRAALYARVSTDKQAEKYGIPSQIDGLKKRSLERGWTQVIDGDKDAFIDDGYSGVERTLIDQPLTGYVRLLGKEDWTLFWSMILTGSPGNSFTR